MFHSVSSLHCYRYAFLKMVLGVVSKKARVNFHENMQLFPNNCRSADHRFVLKEAN